VRPRPPLPQGPYLVVGLARSGAGAARMLAPYGEVIGVDAGEPAEAESLRAAGIELHLRSDGLDLVDSARTVVKSPGVPREAPVVAAAVEHGIDVLGELEVAWRLIPSEFVAVTGTNGKTTTVELLGAIHREAGIRAPVAGNVGTAVSELVGESLGEHDVVICEASSFQLEDATAFAPEAAVLLNLEEDHLDRHGTFDAYRAAKLRIFANQEEYDIAVVPPGLSLSHIEARTVRFGEPGAEMSINDAGELVWRGEPLMPAAEIRMRGDHNRANAMAAAATALARGLDRDAVRRALATFPGVAHRLEEVAVRDGVTYVNDSKATNVASAIVGIRAFEGGVHLILGGSLKGGGFAGLRAPVEERCRACYLIGQAAEQIASDLDGTVPLRRCGDLEHAVRAASEAARPGEVVLLSPACASYDQYRSFEERGAHFRRLAAAG
jgi:UDP-N-acetylmuramoylalanine--D-glutamate ligase